MTPREFRQEKNLEFDHFQELTSTSINPNYANIEMFAHEYHKAKLKLSCIGVVRVSDLDIDVLTKVIVKQKVLTKGKEFLKVEPKHILHKSSRDIAQAVIEYLYTL